MWEYTVEVELKKAVSDLRVKCGDLFIYFLSQTFSVNFVPTVGLTVITW